ncbi:MAG: acyl-CoA dehydrogenase family protein [Rhodospirillales bacterium]|jgi:3-hydroxy-9,10-secoandrosta-1,3,5(10)-triene-9,17-dione monooxygenase
MTDGKKLIEDLQALVPILRERGSAAEEAGRIPEETIEDLKRINAFKAVVPKAYGGMEVDFPFIPQIFRMMGRGCVSTSWCMGFLIYHNFQFGHYNRKAQEEAFGGVGYTMAAGLVVPGGQATRVDGGFVLNGRWNYATGILHCDYLAMPAPVASEFDPDGPPDFYRFYVPVEQIEVLDTWHVAAMKATGSRDVTLTDVFVPEHRGIPVKSLRERTSPGLQINTGPLWQVPVMTFMAFGTVGSMVGAAEAVFEMVRDILKTKVGAYSGDQQSGLMSQRIRIARIKMELDATIGLLEAKAEFVWETVQRGVTMSREQRAEMRMVVSHITKKCHEIVNELAHTAGTRSVYLDSPIQRFHRDVNALATHAIFEFDHVGSLFGGTLLGIEPPATAMI